MKQEEYMLLDQLDWMVLCKSATLIVVAKAVQVVEEIVNMKITEMNGDLSWLEGKERRDLLTIGILLQMKLTQRKEV